MREIKRKTYDTINGKKLLWSEKEEWLVLYSVIYRISPKEEPKHYRKANNPIGYRSKPIQRNENENREELAKELKDAIKKKLMKPKVTRQFSCRFLQPSSDNI